MRSVSISRRTGTTGGNAMREVVISSEALSLSSIICLRVAGARERKLAGMRRVEEAGRQQSGCEVLGHAGRRLAWILQAKGAQMLESQGSSGASSSVLSVHKDQDSSHSPTSRTLACRRLAHLLMHV